MVNLVCRKLSIWFHRDLDMQNRKLQEFRLLVPPAIAQWFWDICAFLSMGLYNLLTQFPHRLWLWLVSAGPCTSTNSKKAGGIRYMPFHFCAGTPETSARVLWRGALLRAHRSINWVGVMLSGACKMEDQRLTDQRLVTSGMRVRRIQHTSRRARPELSDCAMEWLCLQTMLPDSWLIPVFCLGLTFS